MKYLQRSYYKSSKDSIDDFFSSNQFGEKMLEMKLRHDWEIIMGKVIAERASIIEINDGVLSLKVNSAALRNELSMNMSKFIEHLNKNTKEGFIKQIIFK